MLDDTLIAFPRHPYLKSARKRLTTHPIYYLFDLGVMNALCRRLSQPMLPGTALYGRLFEHFVLLELHRLLQYFEKEWLSCYWRTAAGAEVDIVLETGGERLAVEIKSADHVDAGDLTGLRRFLEDYPGSRGLYVCNADRPFAVGPIECLPWRSFFNLLFAQDMAAGGWDP